MAHWTENDFRDWLYGLKEDGSHLAECLECRNEAERVAELRRQAVIAPPVPADFLAAQRREIYRRLGTDPRGGTRLRWTLSFATAAMLVVSSVTVLRPSRSKLPLSDPADAQLFSDLTSIEQSSEPRAIRPIRRLFEE